MEFPPPIAILDGVPELSPVESDAARNVYLVVARYITIIAEAALRNSLNDRNVSTPMSGPKHSAPTRSSTTIELLPTLVASTFPTQTNLTAQTAVDFLLSQPGMQDAVTEYANAGMAFRRASAEASSRNQSDRTSVVVDRVAQSFYNGNDRHTNAAATTRAHVLLGVLASWRHSPPREMSLENIRIEGIPDVVAGPADNATDDVRLGIFAAKLAFDQFIHFEGRKPGALVFDPAQPLPRNDDELWTFLATQRAIQPSASIDITKLDEEDVVQRLRLGPRSDEIGEARWSDPEFRDRLADHLLKLAGTTNASAILAGLEIAASGRHFDNETLANAGAGNSLSYGAQFALRTLQVFDRNVWMGNDKVSTAEITALGAVVAAGMDVRNPTIDHNGIEIEIPREVLEIELAYAKYALSRLNPTTKFSQSLQAELGETMRDFATRSPSLPALDAELVPAARAMASAIASERWLE